MSFARSGSGTYATVVEHDADADVARPAGAVLVIWSGTVQPNAMTGPDMWVNPDDTTVAEEARIIDEDHATTTVVNSTVETTLTTLTIPAGLVEVGDLLIVEAFGEVLNNSVGAVTCTFRFKIGATTVITSSAMSLTNAATLRRWRARFVISVSAAAAQRVGGTLNVTAGSSVTMPTSNSALDGVGYGTAAEDLSVSKNALLTVALGTADLLAEVSIHAASLTYMKKHAA